MGYKLQISDGTTTVDLTSLTTTWIKSFQSTFNVAERVSDEITIVFRDATLANTLTTIRAIERLLTYAPHLDALPVFLYFNIDTDNQSEMRARIYRGEIEYNPDALKTAVYNRFECTISFERGEWQAANETQLPLTNRNGTNVTTALAVENANDASRDNFVQIASSNAASVSNAPLRFEFVNTSGSALARIYMGIGAYQDFSVTGLVLEGEDSTAGGTATSDATCSGGYYMAITGIGATDTVAARWALTAAQVQALAGRTYNVLARFRNLPAANMYATPIVTLTGQTAALQPRASVPLATDVHLQDLGTLQIPPALFPQQSYSALDVVLIARKVGGSGTLALDYLLLMPTDGGFCVYSFIGGANLANGATLVDDGAEGNEQVYIGTTTRQYNVARNGASLRVIPNRTQRLYVAMVAADGTANIDLTGTFKVYYRPTRTTL